MQAISDILLTAGTFSAAIYCYVLSLRLRRFQTLEGGLGGAIAVLSAQVDDMTRALDRARGAAEVQSGSLEDLARRGEAAAARLELLLASLHDLPERAAAPPPVRPATEPQPQDRRPRVLRRRVARTDLEAAE